MSRGDHHVTDAFRMYRWTTVYICCAATVVVALLMWDLTHGPLLSPCP